MDYLKPIEQLENSVRFYRILIFIFLSLFTVGVIATVWQSKTGNPVVIEQDGIVSLIQAQPWKATTGRIESLSRAFVSSRFDWNADSFAQKQIFLKAICKDKVFTALEKSSQNFYSLIHNQGAISYSVFEGYGFSNETHKVEIHAIQDIRIKDAVMAIPFVIKLTFEDSAITDADPYGLTVTGLEEIDPQAPSTSGKGKS